VSRVLVTGASGFIGQGTLAPLLDKGFEVHAVSSRGAPTGTSEDVRWHVADLLECGQEERLMARIEPELLLHLAWYAVPGRFWTSSANVRWVEASLRLLRALVAHGGRRAVVAGSCAERRPTTLYGVSKDGLRRIAQAYSVEQGLSLAWARLFFFYGPREQPLRLVPSVARAVLAGEPALCTHGGQVRDFLYIDDVGGALAALVESDVDGVVEVGSGHGVTIAEVVRSVADAAGAPQLLQLGAIPERPGEPAELVADVGQLRKETGWRPTVPLAEGIERTIAWWRGQT
jgi:nucleoside-diphosphate-sugar epimerase